jgi:glucokinase
MKALVADIGGTRIKVGLVHHRTLVASRFLEARSHEGLRPQLPRIAVALRELCVENNIVHSECDGVGFAFPSVIEPGTGRICDAYGKYADAPQIDLQAWGTQEFGLPGFIENDARLALLGEWTAGAGRGCNDIVMMTLGTGIGTAALIGGEVVRGRHGQAAILGGHTTIRYDGAACICGNRGCAETEASIGALLSRARWHDRYAVSTLQALQPEHFDFAAVLHHARLGDVCASALLEHCINIWSAVIVSLVHSFDPERVVVGGGISEGAADFMQALARRVHSLAHTPWGTVELVPAQLGNCAALMGAAALVEERIHGAPNTQLR